MNSSFPITVTHLIYSLGLGGSQRTLLALWQHRPSDWLNYHFCALTNGGLIEKRLKDAGAPVHILNKPKGFHPFAMAKVYDLLRLIKTDIVHVHELSTQGYALPAAILAGIDKRVTSYHSVARTLSQRQLRIARFTAGYYSVVHTVGDQVSESLLKAGFPPQKLKCIKNGVVLDDFPITETTGKTQAKANLGIGDYPVVGTIGRFVPKKNIDRVIRAIAILHKEGRRIFLLVVGDGPLQNDLVQLAKSECDPQFVRFLSPTSDVTELYQAMDIFALPSIDEGIPQVVLEAMATGACVITSKTAQISEIITNKTEGVLLDKPDEKNLSQAIQSLLTDDNRMRDIRTAARKQVEKSFSFEETNREYLKMYKELAGLPDMS